MSETTAPKNKLLAELPSKVFQRIKPSLEVFELNFPEKLYDSGEIFSHVYFVESGIVSLLAAVDDRSAMEVAMVGSEGMVALPVFLGEKASSNRAVVQGDGTALRMTTADFLKECATSDDLPTLMRGLAHSRLLQITRSAVCIGFHSIESRLARWLLMTQDRMKSPDFKITQEFLGYMLGVRREAVNKVATRFQRGNLIRYVRGNLNILDRPELEALACSCYSFILATESIKNH